jgi:D-alanyl-lipoteichoic acid acyltransferase DltB (MBOAT superfamily)
MTLTQILVLIPLALGIGILTSRAWRTALIMGSSVLAVYWLQPATAIRNLDFWLPTLAIWLTVMVWAISSKSAAQAASRSRDYSLATSLATAATGLATAATGLATAALILTIAVTRYISPLCCLTASRPPALASVLIGLGLGALIIAAILKVGSRSWLAPAAILLLIGLFILLKSPLLTEWTSRVLRSVTGQAAGLASPQDLTWLGYSYLAFRLLHVLRDSQQGKFKPASLADFVTYALFWPAYTAGPIDRSQHFLGELQPVKPADHTPWIILRSGPLIQGGSRILWGVFKKFVVADSLALIAINPQVVAQTDSLGWLWVLLYAYSFRIYFDFSGYTDIALGLGGLMGFTLPENFERPYTRTSLTAFWNSWHITLAQWFRAYFFNPLTRSLRSGRKIPVWMVIFISQISTMGLIGLWHGISWNFAIWGIWHGLGLFINNRWSAWLRPHAAQWSGRTGLNLFLQAGSWLLTFHWVVLGWVWFALPDVSQALQVFLRLFGFIP